MVPSSEITKIGIRNRADTESSAIENSPPGTGHGQVIGAVAPIRRKVPTPARPSPLPATANKAPSHAPADDLRPRKSPGSPLAATTAAPTRTNHSLMSP